MQQKKQEVEKSEINFMKFPRWNLGSGNSPKINYVNVDIRDLPGVDIVGDVLTLDLGDESIEEILCQDLIEHFTPPDAKRLLFKCYKALKKGGVLNIHFPNLRYLASILTKRDDRETLKWVYGNDGEGEADHMDGRHKWAWSKESMTETLKSIGFTIVHCEETYYKFGLRILAVKK